MKDYDFKDAKKELPPRRADDGFTDYSDNVLVCAVSANKCKFYTVAFYDHSWGDWEDQGALNTEQVTHWCHLPEYP